jgi:ribosome-associated toxin RatA of RatAB toxin-antitoxin module
MNFKCIYLFHFKFLILIPLRLPYFPQLIENWIFSELDRLFCNIAFKIDFIAK